jgi:hypothetical protein
MSTTTQVFLILAALAALIAILPAQYDPAIRLKEWTIKRAKKQ